MALTHGAKIGPYAIEREIGRGGMGVVYLARDTKLDRDVAIKTLPEAVATDAARLARFQREIKLVASLNHPNILTVHDVGRQDDTSYVVMELLRGEDLRQRLLRGPMPWTEALRVAIELVEALVVAHGHGVIHRDLKPANLFITSDDRVKVLDFGLARRDADATSADDARTVSYATQVGQVVGTPGYMSPEQVKGQTVDPRTDLFAAGCILYEMLAGAPAFGRPTVAETTAALLMEAPAALSASGFTGPPELEAIVLRCLQKKAEDRFGTAEDLRSALRDVAAAPASARPGSASHQEARGPSIAVLPFVNQSSDPENEYFSDGIAEELINMLARIDGLRVAARTSAFSFKGQQADIADVGRKLGVATVLEGSVRKSGTRIRITAQLVDAGSGYPLWSERFDRNLDDIFSVQDEIAASILEKLTVTLGVGSAEREVRSPTHNVAAYEHYLRARQHVGRGYGIDLLKALDGFDMAVKIDPDFAAAHAGIAEVYTALAYMTVLPPRESIPKARAAAEHALSLDDRLADAHCALGCINMQYDWAWAEAERRFRLALELNPNFIPTYYHYGHPYLCFVADRIDEGIAMCRQAVELDPLAIYPMHGLVANLLAAGNVDETIDLASRALESQPEAFHFRRLRGLAHFMAARLPEALGNLEHAVTDSGRHPWALYELGSIYAVLDRPDEAQAVQHELVARSTYSCIPTTAIAMIAAWRGRLDDAFDLLQRALKEKDGIIYAVTTWPMARPLWNDARFDQLLGQLGLPAPTRSGRGWALP